MDSTRVLNPDEKEIRLLALMPRQYRLRRGAPYTCCFRNVVRRVDDAPDYAAISYVWGNPNETRPILLDGKVKQVTTNLAMALEHFEDQNGRVLLLWVDAICINQDDDLEKSHQVRIMKEIYDKAAEVRVWLGTPTRELESAFRLIDDVMDAFARQYPDDPGLAEDHDTKMGLVRNILFDDDGDALFDPKALEDLTHRAWWTRVWVLQEISTNTQISFFCGSTRLHLSRVEPFLSLVLCFQVYSVLHSTNRNWEVVRKMVTHLHVFSWTPWTTLFMARRRNDGTSLVYLLSSTYHSGNSLYRATRSEDFVFAFLGIASDRDKLGIIPDYTKPCSQIYVEVATAILMKDSASLYDVLTAAQSSKSMTLPSWVPDWSINNKRLSRSYGRSWQRFGAEGHHTCEIQVESTSENAHRATLAVAGTKISLVAEAFDRMWPLGCADIDAYGPFLSDLKSFVHTHGTAYGSREEQEEVLWQLPTLGGGTYGDTTNIVSRMRDDTRKISKHFWQMWCDHASWNHGMEGVMQLSEIARYLVFAQVSQQERRVFATGNGYIGVGRRTVAEGDVICLLYGSPVPFILRPVDNVEGRYELVGETWISGIMDGAFLETDPITETFIIQ